MDTKNQLLQLRYFVGGVYQIIYLSNQDFKTYFFKTAIHLLLLPYFLNTYIYKLDYKRYKYKASLVYY